MSSQYTKVITSVKPHHKLWGLALLLTLLSLLSLNHIVTAASPTTTSVERLVTVYDQGEEKTFVTNQSTIGSALRREGIAFESVDTVEPSADTTLTDKSYQVNIYRARSVVVNDGLRRIQVLTSEKTPKRIMTAAGLTLYDEDRTDFAVSTNPIADGGAGLQLMVDRATVFTLSLYGKTVESRSQASTVGDMLREKGITLGPNDGQSTPDATPLTAGMTIAVWRDGVQTVTQEEIIPKTVEQIQDPTKDYGTREVRTPGVDGAKNVTYEIEMKGGKEVARRVVASVVTREPVKEVIAIGTRYKGAYTTPSENETISWNFFISKGLSREQTAGIMGNLMQEHKFNTTGDGLAQWTGNRKTALLALPDPYNIYTQLGFLWGELSGSSILAHIQAQTTVEGAVRVFQNEFERCGICREDLRIQYAYNILASH